MSPHALKAGLLEALETYGEAKVRRLVDECAAKVKAEDLAHVEKMAELDGRFNDPGATR
jgi:hypothetical protein